MRRVFVDSGGFYALLVKEDAHYQHALGLFQQAGRAGWQLTTTNIVLIETHALLLNRAREGRSKAIAFLDHLAQTPTRVERVRKLDEDHAIALIRAHQDKNYSLCDALSFVVMERLKIKDAIAFDRHFREYGRFVIL